MSLRLLIAEDSALFAEVLVDMLKAEPGIEVLAVTGNGEDAVRLCAELRPDLVLMDIHMPRLDGLSATEAIMASHPTPILVLTSDPHRGGVDLSFRALSAGALDLMAKPSQVPFRLAEREKLLRKIHLLSQIPVVRHVRGRRKHETPTTGTTARHSPSPRPSNDTPLIIGIVASTGGPKALARICQDLPADFPAALVVVQHITEGFSKHLARWLDKHSALRVREAEDGEPPLAGHVYIAPTSKHLVLSPKRTLRVDNAPPIGGHRPSGDRLLMSLARNHSTQSIGVILSGMGDDGTAGLTAMFQARCPTLAQDEATSVVFGMPRSALEAGVVDHVLADKDLASKLVTLVDEHLQGARNQE